jgi:hypothetical protein
MCTLKTGGSGTASIGIAGDGGKDNKTVRLMMRSGLVEFLIIDIVPLSP